MKKLICNIAIIVLSCILLFLPIVSPYFEYDSTITLFFYDIFNGYVNLSGLLWSLILVILALATMTMTVISLFKNSKHIKFAVVALCVFYCIVWLMRIFLPYDIIGVYSIREALKNSSYPALYYLYLIILVAIVVLLAIQYIPIRRPSKVQQLEQRVAELEQQVAEQQDNNKD